MITEEEYEKAKKVVEQYRAEALERLRVETGKDATTTIPEERWGVHRRHCCFEHGCKYGHDDCPVDLGIIKQDYPCEYCHDVDAYYDL